MDQEFSDEITGLMPIIPHGIAGADCSGFVIAVVENSTVELRCNQCGACVGVVQVGVMEGLLGLDCFDEACLRCGKFKDCVSENFLCGGCEHECERETKDEPRD